MTMQHKGHDSVDDELRDLDFSKKPIFTDETVKSGDTAARTLGASKAERGTEASMLKVEGPGEDDNWKDDKQDLGEIGDFSFGQRQLSGAEKRIIEEIDSIVADPDLQEDPPESDKNSADSAQPIEILELRAESGETISGALPTSQLPPISGLPDGFSFRAEGIFVVNIPEKGDDGLKEQFLCSPLRVIGLFRERDGSAWGRRIVVTNPEGREITVTVLNEMLEARGRNFLSQIAGLGLRIGKVKRARETIVDLLMTWNADKLMLSTNRQG